MRVALKVDGVMILAGVAGVAALAAWWWWDDLKSAVNPADPDNVVNSAVNDAVQAVTGTEDTLGTLAYEYRALSPLSWPSIAREWWEYGETEETRRFGQWLQEKLS